MGLLEEEETKITAQEWIDRLRLLRCGIVEDYRLFVLHIKNLENVQDLSENEDEVESVLTAECLLLKSKMEKLLEELDG